MFFKVQLAMEDETFITLKVAGVALIVFLVTAFVVIKSYGL